MSSKPQPDILEETLQPEQPAPAPAVERELWVENRLGLHARPVAKITALAQGYETTSITLEKDGVVADARDLLAILSLDSPQGSRLVLRASGPQAREAAMTIASLFARKFGET
ncbi:MAG: HPr family phosphocarrier protein [Desulfobaccales bacterium]